MFNKNVANVARFDFLNTMKSKGFIVLNVVLCVLVVLAINLSSIISLFKSTGIIHSNDYVIEVWDPQGNFFKALNEDKDSDLVKEVRNATQTVEYNYENIDPKVIGINIESDSSGIIKSAEIISKDTISDSVTEYITNNLNKVRNKAIEDKYHISEADSKLYKDDVELKETILSNAKNQNKVTGIVSTIMGYIIFMLVMTITTTVASSIANEKTSKSAEYILSTIPSKDYLNGKVLAANLKTVLTIVLIVFYVLMGLVLNSLVVPLNTGNTGAVSSEINTLGSIKIEFNVFAYLAIIIFMIFITNTIISYIQAGLASRIKSISELDSAIMLPTVILVVAYFISNMLPNTNNVLTNILSCIPILSMYVLPTAYMLNKVSLIGITVSFAILLITLVIVYKIVSGKFKNNLLDLGKKKPEKEDEKLALRKLEEKKLLSSKLNKFVMCVAFALILSMTLGNTIGIVPYFTSNENIKLILNSLVFIAYIGIPAWVLSKLIPNVPKTKKASDKTRKEKIKWYLVGLVGLVVAQIINIIFVYVLGISQSETMEVALKVPSTLTGIVLYVIYLALIPAIFEELLFRKVILNGAKQFGNVFAILFTSILFGLFHQNLQQILGTALIGMVLAIITFKTGDVKTSMCVHFTNNLFASLIQIIYAQMSNGNITTISLVCISIVLVILIFAFIGLVLLIKILITKKGTLKQSSSEEKNKMNIATIFSNYYVLILFLTMILTTMLNSKLS